MEVVDRGKGCGGRITARRYSNIKSPNYPQKYPNNIECIWDLVIDESYHLNFTFPGEFDIEMSNNCENDYLLFEEKLYNNDSWIAVNKFCGRIKPNAFRSLTNHIRITFRTNQEINSDGFVINYRKACGEVYNTKQGVIMSPNYPEDYNTNVKCQWLIVRKSGDYIQLEFDDEFAVEQHPSCYFDALDVYLGNDTTATRRGPYCGTGAKPPDMISTGSMLLTFRSDSTQNLKGFKATYSVSSCGGILTDAGGEFESPLNRYMRGMNCIWHIQVQENRVIELKFLKMDTEA